LTAMDQTTWCPNWDCMAGNWNKTNV